MMANGSNWPAVRCRQWQINRLVWAAKASERRSRAKATQGRGTQRSAGFQRDNTRYSPPISVMVATILTT